MDKHVALSLTLIGGAFLMLGVGLLAMFSGAESWFMAGSLASLVLSILLGGRAIAGSPKLYNWQAIIGIVGVILLVGAAQWR